MVDADWEMKRISLGLSDTGIEKFPTYIDLEFENWRRRVLAEGIRTRRPEGGSRFWFYPAYTEFEHSEKLDAIEIPSDAVQLLTESHFATWLRAGRLLRSHRRPRGSLCASLRALWEPWHRKPLFSDLRNLFDWVAVARLIQKIDAPPRNRLGLGIPGEWLSGGRGSGARYDARPSCVATRGGEIVTGARQLGDACTGRGIHRSDSVTPLGAGRQTSRLQRSRQKRACHTAGRSAVLGLRGNPSNTQRSRAIGARKFSTGA